MSSDIVEHAKKVATSIHIAAPPEAATDVERTIVALIDEIERLRAALGRERGVTTMEPDVDFDPPIPLVPDGVLKARLVKAPDPDRAARLRFIDGLTDEECYTAAAAIADGPQAWDKWSHDRFRAALRKLAEERE